MPTKERGFTLIEVGIVIGAIAILSLIVLLASGYIDASRQQSCVQMADALRKDAEVFSQRYNSGVSFTNVGYPTAITIALPGSPANAAATPWGGAVSVSASPATATAPCSNGGDCVEVCEVMPDANTCAEVAALANKMQGVVPALTACGGAGCVAPNALAAASVLSVYLR